MVLTAKDSVGFTTVGVDTLWCRKDTTTVGTRETILLNTQSQGVRREGEVVLPQQSENITVPLLDVQNHSFLVKVTIAGSADPSLPLSSVTLPLLNKVRQVGSNEDRVSNNLDFIEPLKVSSEPTKP